MKSSDNFLDKLRRKQAKKKKSIFSEIRSLFRRNARRFKIAGLFTLILSVLALVPGLGATITVNITSSEIRFPGHPCLGYTCNGSMKATFNPVLYPVNHILNREVSAEFSRISEPDDYSGQSVKDVIIFETLFLQLPINIPLFYALGFILAGQEKAIRKKLR